MGGLYPIKKPAASTVNDCGGCGDCGRANGDYDIRDVPYFTFLETTAKVDAGAGHVARAARRAMASNAARRDRGGKPAMLQLKPPEHSTITLVVGKLITSAKCLAISG